MIALVVIHSRLSSRSAPYQLDRGQYLGFQSRLVYWLEGRRLWGLGLAF